MRGVYKKQGARKVHRLCGQGYGIVSYFWITDPNAGGTLTEIILSRCGQSFEIGTLLLSTTTACATTRTADHQHRPETTTTGGETLQASYQEIL